MSIAKINMVAEKVMAKCDEVDGLKDGIIDDPRQCSFDPVRDVPACSAGTDSADCLTPPQAATLKKIYEGPGRQRQVDLPGLHARQRGSDCRPQRHEEYDVGQRDRGRAGGAKPADFDLAEGVMRYLVLDPPQPEYDTMTFDYERAPGLVARWSKLADANDPDLSKFRKSGGKLIMTYGWADQILQPLMGVRYYEAVLAKNGRKTMDFARLFMVPGMAHCGGGVGPDRNDAVTAVIDWVEKGKAPVQIIASKVTAGQVVRTRPLCPYPQVARYQWRRQHRRSHELRVRGAAEVSSPGREDAGSREGTT